MRSDIDMVYVAVSDRGDIGILIYSSSLVQNIDDSRAWYLNKYYTTAQKLPQPREVIRYVAIVGVDDKTVDAICAHIRNAFVWRHIRISMIDRKLTVLGVLLLTVTVLLYYVYDQYAYVAYVTGVAMLIVLGVVFYRVNKRYFSSGKR